MISVRKESETEILFDVVSQDDRYLVHGEVLHNSRLDGIEFFFSQKVSHDDFFQRD